MLMNTKTKVILSFITVFLLGGISGYLVRDTLLVKEQFAHSERFSGNEDRNGTRLENEQERREHRQRMRERAQNRLIEYLSLEENQQEEFFSLLHTYHTDIRDSVRTIRDLEDSFIREHYDEFKIDLSDLLNQQQLNRMDRFFHPDSVRYNRANRDHRN